MVVKSPDAVIEFFLTRRPNYGHFDFLSTGEVWRYNLINVYKGHSLKESFVFIQPCELWVDVSDEVGCGDAPAALVVGLGGAAPGEADAAHPAITPAPGSGQST